MSAISAISKCWVGVCKHVHVTSCYHVCIHLPALDWSSKLPVLNTWLHGWDMMIYYDDLFLGLLSKKWTKMPQVELHHGLQLQDKSNTNAIHLMLEALDLESDSERFHRWVSCCPAVVVTAAIHTLQYCGFQETDSQHLSVVSFAMLGTTAKAKLSLTHATITSLTHAYVTYTCKRFCYVTCTCTHFSFTICTCYIRGFGVGFRGRVSGFRGGVVMPCAQHGNVARYSKDTSTCTLLYLETSGFRGGASGWGFGVGFRGFGPGFRGGVVMPCAPHGNVARHSKDTSTCTLLYLETMPVAMECEINTPHKPGSPWRTLVAIHNFVASAFLHYKISTQKCFRPC